MSPARWAALLALAIAAAAPAWPAAPASLRVGTYANAPLIFRDAAGTPQGIYVDVLEHIARQERWTLEYVEGSWEQCLERLRRGEIDLLVAIGYSTERSRLFDFSREPVVINWGQVYVRRSSDIRTLLDLTGRPLAVVRGDIYYESLRTAGASLQVFPRCHMPLTITSEQGQGFVTIRPAGSLDSNTYTYLEEHIAAIAKRKPRALVLDLKDLSYISSAGVRVVIATQKAMKAAGGEMALTNLQPQIRKVFEIIMALPSMNVFESVADLDRYLTGIQKKVLGEDEK